MAHQRIKTVVYDPKDDDVMDWDDGGFYPEDDGMAMKPALLQCSNL
jgi:hypothetical protein